MKHLIWIQNEFKYYDENIQDSNIGIDSKIGMNFSKIGNVEQVPPKFYSFLGRIEEMMSQVMRLT